MHACIAGKQGAGIEGKSYMTQLEDDLDDDVRLCVCVCVCV